MKMHSRSSAGSEVVIPTGGVSLAGTLNVPRSAFGLVIFAHGSGSSRFSPRNHYVAEALNRTHLATLLIDLLTPLEGEQDEITAEYRFDVLLLAERLSKAIEWAEQDDATKALAVGLFGASTGAAAALIAAARRADAVKAVVSRGGRPDLAGDTPARVKAPTLFIVGARDPQVIVLNRQAAERLTAEHQLIIVPDATHLFEEPGTLEEVAFLAADWFERHLGPPPRLTGGVPLRLVRQPHGRSSAM